MGNDFAKVRAGDRLRIPAAAYNAFVDAAIAQRSAPGGSAPGSHNRDLPGSYLGGDIIFGKYVGIGDLPAYSALHVNRPLNRPGPSFELKDTFQQTPLPLLTLGPGPPDETPPNGFGVAGIILEPVFTGPGFSRY